MKWLALIFLVCVGFAAYRVHEKTVQQAEMVAREEALAQGRRESAAQLAAERAARKKEEEERAEREALNAKRLAMAVSKVVEPLLMNVQAPLDINQPADLVPMIELTKQRILDKRVHAEAERQPVYDYATAVLDQLAALAEERTNFLEAMLRNRSSAGTMLNRPNTGSTSTFFNQNQAKRWEETVTRTKPTLLQAMEQLRAAERQWNKQLEPGKEVEMYDVVSFAPLLIPADQVSQNSLSAAAKPAAGTNSTTGTTNRIWRRSYYNTYGYRYPGYSTSPYYYPNYPSYP
jgi:hypothetical protein